MSTETVTESVELPPMADIFNKALAERQASDASAEVKVDVKTEKVDTSTDTSKETPKQDTKSSPESKGKDQPKETASSKKKSALDAALEDAPKEETAPVDEVQQLIESKDPNWSKARETMKRQSEELVTLREATKKASEPSPEHAQKLKAYEAEVKELREQMAQYKDAMVSLDVKYDPEFQHKYVKGREKHLMSAASKVESAGGDKQAFLDAMELTGAKRSMALREVLGSIDGYEKAAIEKRLGDIDAIEEEMGEVLSNSQQSFEKISRKRQLEIDSQNSEVSALKDSTIDRIAKELQKSNGLFRPSPSDAEGAEEYNAGLTEDIKAARGLIDSNDPNEVTAIGLKAARFDRITTHLRDRLSAEAKRADDAEAALARYEGSEPGFRGGGNTNEKQPWDVPMDQLFHQALK